MKVTLLDTMGNDDTVVNAARVSFSKKAEDYTPEQNAKLINYLAKHGHTSPFRHPQLSFHIKAPLFVARQLGKHTIGLTWNEISRRYVEGEIEWYVPKVWRKKAEDKKQGSSSEEVTELLHPAYGPGSEDWWGDVDNKHHPSIHVDHWTYCAVSQYRQLLAAGICPEQARMVLPQNVYTEWHWTGSLYAFIWVCKLRCAPDTQEETRDVANQILSPLHDKFPLSTSAFFGTRTP